MTLNVKFSVRLRRGFNAQRVDRPRKGRLDEVSISPGPRKFTRKAWTRYQQVIRRPNLGLTGFDSG